MEYQVLYECQRCKRVIESSAIRNHFCDRIFGEPESSPLKYLPRLVKRSTSVDEDASSWKFFSDIKARNQDDGSPLKSKTAKDNSSHSDSEELSESSISKTCEIASTTEGVEMSSDDDTPSIEKDKKSETALPATAKASPSGLRQRFRLLKSNNKNPKEGSIATSNLSKLYNINTDKVEQALPDDSDIESGVDALEDSNWQEVEDKVLKAVSSEYDNIKIDKSKVVNIKEVPGGEVKRVHWNEKQPKTIYAPVGFVDMRSKSRVQTVTYLPLIMLSVLILIYALIHSHSSYFAGILIGVILTYIYFYIKSMLYTPLNPPTMLPPKADNILQVPAVKEYQPLSKYEGWVNEFPGIYNPYTYHISQTQSVYLRLQGNLLRISHSRNKVPKRALWNEVKIKPIFTHHRVYNLLGAKLEVLPEGLAKRKHWSKKYPICITLNKDQMNFESPELMKEDDDEEDKDRPVPAAQNRQRRFHLRKKKSNNFASQRFSKLTEEEEEDYELDSDNSRASTPSPPSPDISEEPEDVVQDALNENLKKDDEENEDETESLNEDWGTFTPEESPTETKIFLFGRTDREKEDWFRRLTSATHKGANVPFNESLELCREVSETLVHAALNESDYIKYMLIFNKVKDCSGLIYKNNIPKTNRKDETSNEDFDILWVNAFVGRILFDCLRDDNFTQRVKDRIQRKLASIKLPYFIEELLVTELNLGKTPPLIHKASKPIIDERGLWIDLDITYEGTVVLILQTKLNLMKLKQPHQNDRIKSAEKPAMFHSDIDDSAESTSDEESMSLLQNPTPLDSSGLPIAGLGGTSNASKRFIKMVDRIAESKFFQVATENRYIKKAMEEVSNTDLRLKVEVTKLVGTLVLNIPPPPSDRVWVGFRPTPDLGLAAHPIVGERNITFLRITSWIEKKLLLEFQKLLVIPNMEDLLIPVMSQKLPQ